MRQHSDIAASRATAPSPWFPIVTPPDTVPLPYQLAGVEYAVLRPHALIGDAPGLGKTAEAVMVGNLVEAKRTLVVCPASLRLNWQREILIWSTLPNVTTYPVLKSTDGISHKHHYVIVSYALLSNKNLMAAITATTWDHVICDEAHMLKDPRGNKRTEAVFNYLPGVTGRFTFLSGTIAPNQPVEIYNAARLLCWDAIDCMSLERFRERYYDLGPGMVTGPWYNPAKQAWEVKAHYSDKVRNVPIRLDELQGKLRRHFMVRRTKAEVLPQLPPVRWTPLPLIANAAVRRALAHPGWAAAEQLYSLDPDAFNHGIPVDGAISTARRELGEAKAPLVAEYVSDLLNSGIDKIVVTAWHRSTLGILAEKLEPFGLVYMDGGTSTGRKQVAVDTFQADPRVRVMLGQTMVVGEGWTLTAAQDVVLAEPDWVPGRNQQAVDRIHRIGQKGDNLQAHIPMVPGTLDERVLGVAIAKDRHLHKLLDQRN